MEKTASIEQVLDNTDKTIIVKKGKSVIPGIILILAGICLIIIMTQAEVPSRDLILPLLMVAGAGLVIWGIVAIFCSKPTYRSAGDGKRLYISEAAFDVKEQKELLRILAEEDFHNLDDLTRSYVNGLKLRVAATKDGSLCYTQATSYIPHEYVNICEVRSHGPEEAKLILAVVKKR